MSTKPSKKTPTPTPASTENAFLDSLTPEQRAQFEAMRPKAPTTPTPAEAQAKRDAARGTASPRASDDPDEETIPAAVASVGATHKATGPTITPAPKRPGLTVTVSKRDKRTGAIKTHTIPTVEALRAYGPLTVRLENQRGETVAVWSAEPKSFNTKSWGFNVGGTKLHLDVGAGCPFVGQVSVNLTQIHSKPGADE